jgi:hypothetical protein
LAITAPARASEINLLALKLQHQTHLPSFFRDFNCLQGSAVPAILCVSIVWKATACAGIPAIIKVITTAKIIPKSMVFLHFSSMSF